MLKMNKNEQLVHLNLATVKWTLFFFLKFAVLPTWKKTEN